MQTTSSARRAPGEDASYSREETFSPPRASMVIRSLEWLERRMYESAYGRPPGPDELAAATGFLTEQTAHHGGPWLWRVASRRFG